MFEHQYITENVLSEKNIPFDFSIYHKKFLSNKFFRIANINRWGPQFPNHCHLNASSMHAKREGFPCFNSYHYHFER